MGLRFPAGPDFATDVLGDPWDFSNAEDLSPDPDEFGGWSEFAQARISGTAAAFLENGLFSGITNSFDPQLGLLYRGGYNIVNPGRTGIRYPIPTAQYQKVSARITYGATASAGSAVLYWFFYPNGHPSSPTGFGSTAIGLATSPGIRTHVFEIPSVGPLEGAAWTAESFVRGLRLDPTSQNAIMDITIDWVRLTASDATTTANMFVHVTCAGDWTVIALDTAGGTQAETPLRSGTGTTRDVKVNHGVLPPGDYSLGLLCNGTLLGPVTPFKINAPASVKVTSPGFATGEDYAAATLPNGAWDMAQDADVPRAGHVLNPAFVSSPSGRDYRARNLADGSQFAGDPQVYLLAEANQSTPIAGSRYRFLTYTLTVEGEYNLGQGSVARVFWSSSPFSSLTADTSTTDIKVWPGRQSYTIDLARLSATPDVIEGRGLETSCAPTCPADAWATRSARFFRIDPHEFPTERYFQLGTVKLTAMPEVAIGQTFSIKYRNEDPIFQSGDQHVLNFWADTDNNPNTRGVLLNPIPVTLTTPWAPGQADRTFDWTVPVDFTAGLYYIYAEITDAATGEVRGAYSDVTVRVFVPPTTTVTINVVRPASGASLFVPFTITGCASNPGVSGNSGVDDILITATGGDNVTPAQRGVTLSLGESPQTNPEFGTKQVNIQCPGADTHALDTSPAAAFAQSGFSVSTVYGLSAGNWTLRVLARDAVDGRFTEKTVPFVVGGGSAPARNLRLVNTSGNNITIAWDPPDDGLSVTGYRIEVSASSTFAPLLASVVTPATVTSGSGSLPNGVWYIRIITLTASSLPSPPSNVLTFTLPGGGTPTPPGPPALTATQVSSNPITLSWAPGTGGAPTSYTLQAGTSPGASDLGTFPMGAATSISAAAPVGLRIYVRVVAQNAIGSATSNEINFMLAAPSAPGAPSLNPAVVSGRNITLTWTPGSGGTPTGYTVLARFSPTGPVVVSLPLTGTSFSTPAPPGTYFVSVTASNGAGTSAESNVITVVVP